MFQLSSDRSEQVLNNQNNNNFDEQNHLIGSANTLKRAMTVTKLNEMLDCIKDMKLYAKTIEQDVPDYLNTVYTDKNEEIATSEFQIKDILQLAKQRAQTNRYILLNDLIQQQKKSTASVELSFSTKNNHQNALLDKQVKYMKRIIAAQPSALEAIYLEALLNPDQWQYNHQLLQTSPMDNLTKAERKRLNEILNKRD